MDSLIVANLKQRPLRTAVSVIGVALGVILVVLTVGLARGMMRDSAERQSNVDAEVRFAPKDYNPMLGANPLSLPERFVDAIKNGVQPTPDNPDLQPIPPIAGIAAIAPVGTWIQSSIGGLGLQLIDGIHWESFVKTTDIQIIQGRALGNGETPGTEYEAIVDETYFADNKDVNGQPLRLGSAINVLGHQFTVVGVYSPSLMARVKIPLRTMQDILGGSRNCSLLLIKCERPELDEQAKKDLLTSYPGYAVVLARDLPALFSRGIVAVDIFLNVVITLAVVISILVILLAMYTSIMERTREIGVLKSLGASKPFILMTIEKEAALIGLLGVALGFAVSLVGKVLIEAGTRLIIDLELRWLLIGAVIGIVGSIVGAFYPALRAARIDPIEALSYE